MKKVFIKALICLTVAVSTLGSLSTAVKADAINLSSIESMINAAYQNKKFESFNIAYNAISNVQDEALRNKYLEQIAPLAKELYTDRVLYYCNKISELAKTGSAKQYDDIVTNLSAEAFNDDTRNYLLTEVMNWGKKLTYTSDYVAATNAIIKDWNLYKRRDFVSRRVVNSAIQDTKKIVEKVVNNYSKEYAYEMLSELEKSLAYAQEDDSRSTLGKLQEYVAVKGNLSSEEKAAYLGYIFKTAGIAGIPDGYFCTKESESFANIFEIVDLNDDFVNKLQNNVAYNICAVESKKISTVATLQINKTGQDMDVTSQVISTSNDLISGAKIIADTRVFNDNDKVSDLIYVKDNKVYLKATKDINENNIIVKVQVKFGTSSSGVTAITIKIKQ